MLRDGVLGMALNSLAQLDTGRLSGRYLTTDGEIGGVGNGGTLTLAEAATPNQGYLASNWYYGGDPATDRYARDGASSLILFAIADSPTEGYHAGDLVFLVAPVGHANDPIVWTAQVIIHGNELGLGLLDTTYIGRGGGAPARVIVQEWSEHFLDLGYTEVKGGAYLQAVTGNVPGPLHLNPDGGPVVFALPIYISNAAALAGGVPVGACYRTGGDPDVICIVH